MLPDVKLNTTTAGIIAFNMENIQKKKQKGHLVVMCFHVYRLFSLKGEKKKV